MSSASLTAIVAFRNEYPAIYGVLQALSRTTCIERVIAVDDGSDDHVGEEITKQFPKIHHISLKSSIGKTGAIREAFTFVKTQHVLLMDGDYKHVDENEVEEKYTVFLKNNPDLLICKVT